MDLRLKKVKREVRKNVTTRFSDAEYANVVQKAYVHTDGNIAEWIRYAAQHCIPKTVDLEKTMKTPKSK